MSVDELSVLLPEEEVVLPDGRKILLKPWSLAQFAQAAAVLMEIINSLTPLGLTFENAEDFLRTRWPELLPVVLPHFLRLIAVSLPELDLKGLDAGTLAGLGLRVLLANREALKNFLTLVSGSAGTGVNWN